MVEGRAQRRVTFVTAKLRNEDGWQDVQIGNISVTGKLVKAADLPRLGEIVEIRHRGWGVTGHVMWRSRMGIQSLEPIDVHGLLEDSGNGRQETQATNNIARSSFWRRLRGR